MQDFFEFYQFGGFFNHVVTLLCLGSLATLVLHAVGPRRAGGEAPLLGLADRFTILAVAAGVLGTLFNTIEMGAALSTIAAEHYMPAMARGMSLVPIPLAFALLCAIPLGVATGCLRHRARAA